MLYQRGNFAVKSHLPIYCMSSINDGSNIQGVSVIQQRCTQGQLCCTESSSNILDEQDSW